MFVIVEGTDAQYMTFVAWGTDEAAVQEAVKALNTTGEGDYWYNRVGPQVGTVSIEDLI